MNVPENWSSGVLGDVISSIRGGYSVKCEDRQAAACEMAVLKTGAVLNGRFDPSKNKYVPPSEHDSLRASVKAGTIIFCRKNSEDAIGAAALASEDLRNVFLSDLLWELQPAPDVDTDWLISCLQSGSVRRRIQISATGTQSTMKNISQDRLLDIPLAIPPRSEQRKIAATLRTWDKALDKLTALRAAKIERNQAMTHALVFGSTQLDHFRTSDDHVVHRWFKVPASWGCKPIGALAAEVSDRNGDATEHEVLSCSKHQGFVRSLEYFKKQVFSADLSGYKKIWRNDFGFPSNHVEEGSIGLQNLTEIGLVSPIYTVFRFDPKKVDADYAFAVLKTDLYRHIFEVSTSSSVDRRGSLRWSEFSRLPFPVPPLEEQRAVAEVISASRSELELIDAQIEAVKRQKRGLMQKLLTGEWRVDVGDDGSV